MKKWIFRIILGSLFALPLGLVSVAWAQASALPQDIPADQNCQECHPAFYTSWEQSSHGQAMTDSEFTEMWQEKGEPGECLTCHATGYDVATHTWTAEGVTCEACHSPIAENHPQRPMPSDRSASLCGKCHAETVFEWQVSSHRELDLACVDCHGQHSTNLKADDASALCASCHRDRASNFAHTAHSEEGLTCADCHLKPLDGVMGEGHATRDHSFHVQLSTCNECHGYQMHDPVAVHLDDGVQEIASVQPDALASVETLGVSIDPDPVSPVYYALLSALFGMAFGLLVAPWIERWYRRLKIDVEDVE